MIKAFIFDVDGTLADTERHGHRVAFNQAFEQFGLDWHWSEQTYGELLAVTGGKERMLHYVQTHDKAEQQRDDLEQLIRQLHAQKTRNYVQLLSDSAIPLRPGIQRLLQEARDEDIRLAIATTTTPDNVTALLENALGADSLDWFEVIGAGDIVPHKKPAPDIYFYVLEKLGLDAADCVAFEDSRNGILASL
ncbi:MAG: HAD-IA family hydrolase, partial [Gammaproteobacteria bacterium]|nr:HAD-IA family hydrolase [Gammaproteobacteria bacterium]